jgi:GR25 family glycosyltransferase involved in LPS biosynthesis
MENILNNTDTLPELLQYTLYINLENRKDRLKNIETQMKNMGIKGERVNAVHMADGAVGCTLSHIRCLEMAKARGWPYVFICEDDILFLNPQLLKENLQKFSENTSISWDVVILGGNNCPPYNRVADYCIRVYNNQTTTGYIARSSYYDTLIANFKESANQLMRSPHMRKQYALDIYWKQLQQKYAWYMITPPTVIQCTDYSDIEKREVNYSGLMLDLDKEWLFRQQQFRNMF